MPKSKQCGCGAWLVDEECPECDKKSPGIPQSWARLQKRIDNKKRKQKKQQDDDFWDNNAE